MFSLTFKSTFIFLLLLAFGGQVMASAIMPCEMSNVVTVQQAASDNHNQHMMHNMEEPVNQMTAHECCNEDSSENNDHCGGYCQCLLGGCSLVYVESIKSINDNLLPVEQVVAKQSPSPRAQFLSFLFRPPIV